MFWACLEISRFCYFFLRHDDFYERAVGEVGSIRLSVSGFSICTKWIKNISKMFNKARKQLQCVLLCVIGEKLQLLEVRQNISHGRRDEFSKKARE